jgi:hypothetical protein
MFKKDITFHPFNYTASLKTQIHPSLLEKGRDEAIKKAVFRDALFIEVEHNLIYSFAVIQISDREKPKKAYSIKLI